MSINDIFPPLKHANSCIYWARVVGIHFRIIDSLCTIGCAPRGFLGARKIFSFQSMLGSADLTIFLRPLDGVGYIFCIFFAIFIGIFLKIVINLPWTYKMLPLNENHIGSAVSVFLRYRKTPRNPSSFFSV